MPSSTRMAPPVISARFLYRAPNQHPTATPATEMQKVVQPMMPMAGQDGGFQKGKGHADRQRVNAGGNGHEKQLFVVKPQHPSPPAPRPPRRRRGPPGSYCRR